jgi:transcription initiation factor TFIID subunit 7
MVKFKPLKPPTPAADTPLVPEASSSNPKLKFKFRNSAASSQTPESSQAPEEATADAAPPVKQKRKYTKRPKPVDENGQPIAPPPKQASKATKKRARDENDEETSPAKRKTKDTGSQSVNGSSALSATGPTQPLMPTPAPQKLKLKARTSGSALQIKVKHVGRPPPRPLGVGYDSEAEDAEIDPAIESQFILRMRPGPDCDLLRRAIEEKKIGLPEREGGFGVHFRFFDKEARRSVVIIKGRMYAAAMVDLPCVIEAMKSWNKRDWVKSADVCQMLLVLGVVQNEEQAKNFPLSKEVDKFSHQYAHGLTPPMHWVRKRRFRQRMSYRRIEEVETEVDKLLAADEEAREAGGESTYQILNPDHLDGSESSEDEDEMDYEVEDAEGYEEEDDDADEMARLMEQELGAADDEPIPFTTSHDVAMHAIGADVASAIPTTETPASTSAAETESEVDDDADAESEEGIDEDALAAQQEVAQQREEIADLEKEIANAMVQYEQQPNPLLKQRIMAKIKSLRNDLDLKKASLGDDVD